MKKLVEIAKIKSTNSSNRIEGIYTTDYCLKQIISNKTTPQNRNEKEILGYCDVLSRIHEQNQLSKSELVSLITQYSEITIKHSLIELQKLNKIQKIGEREGNKIFNNIKS